MDKQEWTPERIADWQDRLRHLPAHEVSPLSNRQAGSILDALEAAQATSLQPGQVAVDEAGVRSLVETAALNCQECDFSRKHAYGAQATCDGGLTRGQCRAALLEGLGLAPATPEREASGAEGDDSDE